jgi:hypothetical protein
MLLFWGQCVATTAAIGFTIITLNDVLQVAMEGHDLNPRCCQESEVKFAAHRQPVVLDFY